MPDKVMTAVATKDSARTLGSKNQMAGSAITPSRAVNTISTAVSLCRKYLSTRNLSIWVETAHRTGPEKAKSNHMNPSGLRTWSVLRPPPLQCATREGEGNHMLLPGLPFGFYYFGINTSVTGERGAV